MNIQDALKAIGKGGDLRADQMLAIMRQIMTGNLTDAQIGGFLIALRMKGESIEEITAAATVMRELVAKVDVAGPHLIDVVGTGGDGSSSFNVSTAAALVAAAAGASVAKHGNRAASGNCGSADLLEHAGANINLTPAQIAQCVRNVGFGFMMAPAHHKAMKFAIGPRRELGVRTIFNALGPLTNPALVKRELMGVFSRDLVEPLAHVMQQLGCEHVLVVHSQDGMDEISIASPTWAAELKDGIVRSFIIEPREYPLQTTATDNIMARDPQQSLNLIHAVFRGERSSASEMVVLNAGAAIYVAGLAVDMSQGVRLAREALDCGGAMAKLEDYVKLTQAF